MKSKCRICREAATRKRGLVSLCASIECEAELGLQLLSKNKAAKRKEEVKRDRARKDALKSRSDWLREVQQAVNAYVRLRDECLPCISCGATYPSDRKDVWDAGHLRSVGSSPSTRFNLFNINKQCVRCNRYLSSNALEYRKGLIEKIGIHRVEQIESDNRVLKYSIDYLMRFRDIFRRRLTHLKSIRKKTNG